MPSQVMQMIVGYDVVTEVHEPSTQLDRGRHKVTALQH